MTSVTGVNVTPSCGERAMTAGRGAKGEESGPFLGSDLSCAGHRIGNHERTT
jgi:hypothetical protein